MKTGSSTISTPQCGDRERKAGSGVEVVTYYAESVHLIYFSVFQSDYRWANRCSTWQLQEWLPLIAPHIVGIEWANSQCSPHLPPRREIGEALSPPSEGKKTAEWASDPREWAMDLAGEDRDRDPPVSIPSAKSNYEPHECWGVCWRKLPPRRELSGSEVYAVGTAQNAGSRPPQEPTLRASPPSRPCTDCVYPRSG